MIRLPPTTLSLTMTEVKEFERHSRFKRHLAKEDSLSQSLPGLESKTAAVRKSYDSAHSHTNQPGSEILESPRLLACPPRRLLKSSTGTGSVRSSSRDMPSSSRSGTSSSSAVSRPSGWGNLPMPLPPPFSRDKRSTSGTQYLLPSQRSVQARLGQHGGDQGPPATPPRRSSLRGGHADICPSPSPRRDRGHLVRSAVRLVESFVGPRGRSSPALPPPRTVSYGTGSLARARESRLEPTSNTELEFRVYDDSLPASSQPQTPHNLPEARHRSRLYGPHTAPPRRPEFPLAHQRASWEAARNSLDLTTPGYRGLRGDRENSDSPAEGHEAPRFERDEALQDEEGW
ncbi:hypothetical protein GGR52DRAFT_527694 [Hypoxylon sp. FL1284]|nr:hypothetical protein GGR52DRAFT_527694 [Hypoxylon sp. FL1284]